MVATMFATMSLCESMLPDPSMLSTIDRPLVSLSSMKQSPYPLAFMLMYSPMSKSYPSSLAASCVFSLKVLSNPLKFATTLLSILGNACTYLLSIGFSLTYTGTLTISAPSMLCLICWILFFAASSEDFSASSYDFFPSSSSVYFSEMSLSSMTLGLTCGLERLSVTVGCSCFIVAVL